MRPVLIIHVLGGTLALLSGFLALYTTKGLDVHRKAGLVFVGAMLVMCGGGLVLALGPGLHAWVVVNSSAALLTTILAVTALTTVRRPSTWTRWADGIALPLALVLSVVNLTYGIEAVASGGQREGVPAFPYFLFGTAAAFAAAGDIRVLRRGALKGASRIARHLWRMSYALLIASLSFFIGQADVFPEPIRIRPLLALPVPLVLFTMVYWLWRVRMRRSLRGLSVGRASEAA